MTDITNDTTHQETTTQTTTQAAPTAFEQAKARLDMIKRYYNDGTLINGEDFGIIQGTNSKPTLLKPGAQKLCSLFDLATEIKATHRVVNDQMVAYEVTVALRNKLTGVLEAEGVGMCNSQERRYKNQDKFNVANTLLKMAKKRALVDATLDALGISSLFTQDLEDIQEEPQRNAQPAQPAQTPPQHRAANAPQAANLPPSTPQHIVRLKAAMKAKRAQYTPENSLACLDAINAHLNPSGDSPRIERIVDLPADVADNLSQDIMDGKLKLPVLPVDANAETVAA